MAHPLGTAILPLTATIEMGHHTLLRIAVEDVVGFAWVTEAEVLPPAWLRNCFSVKTRINSARE